MITVHQQFVAKPGGPNLAVAFTQAQANSMWHLLDATMIAQDHPRDFAKWKRLRDKFTLTRKGK